MTASTEIVMTPAERYRSLAAVIIASFGVGISFGMGYPLAALTFEAWGEPKWLIGLVGAAPSVAILVLFPLLPYLIAKVRPINAMIIGCLMSAFGYAGLYFVQDAWTWIFLRFLMGIGLALPWLISETWINMVAEDRNRTRIISFYIIAYFSGFAVGPSLLDAVGTAGPSPFVVGVLGSVLTIIPVWLARSRAPDFSSESTSGVFAAMKLSPVGMAGGFLGGFLETAHFALLANVALESGVGEETALRLLTILLVGGLAPQLILGMVGDVVPRRTVIIGIGIVFLIASVLLPLYISIPWWGPVVVFLIGGSVMGFYTLALAIIGEELPPRDLAPGNAAFIMMYTIGGNLGAVDRWRGDDPIPGLWLPGHRLDHRAARPYVHRAAQARAITHLTRRRFGQEFWLRRDLHHAVIRCLSKRTRGTSYDRTMMPSGTIQNPSTGRNPRNPNMMRSTPMRMRAGAHSGNV